jgi:hypothetical protein
VVLWQDSGGVCEFLASIDMRETRAMCASMGRYLMNSWGMPYRPKDLPLPRFWMV